MSISPRPLASWTLALSVAVLTFFVGVRPARAQTMSNVTVSVPAVSFNIRREVERVEFPRVASRADCLLSDRSDEDWTRFEFTPQIVYQGISAPLFEVWVGRSDCKEITNRTPGAASDRCARIYQANAVGLRGKVIPLSIRDVAHALNNLTGPDSTTTEGFGTLDDCDAELNLQKVNFYFLLTDGADNARASDASTDRFEIDFVGPASPTGVEVSPGDGYLFPSWTSVEAVDLRGFRFYCSGGTVVDAAAGGAGGEGGAAGSSCSSGTLVPGELVPADTAKCGEILGQLGTSSGRTNRVENGQVYAVGVTSFDRYGNESVLSELACGTPAEVTTFFEAYRDAGGEGGGLCAYRPWTNAVPGLGALGALCVGALALVRRRRRA